MQFVWEERTTDKLISKPAKFSITGNTRPNSRTWYHFFTSPLSSTQSRHKMASNLAQLNPSNYTRLSSTCNSSEVFSSVGENGTEGNSRFQQQCGLAQLSSIPSLVLLLPSTSSHPSYHWTERGQHNQMTRNLPKCRHWGLTLKNVVKIPMERTVEISGLLGFSGKAQESLPKSQ